MGKYIRKEHLTAEERHFLNEIWKASPEFQKLAEQFADEQWVEAELEKQKQVPVEAIWAEINRQLDEMGEPDFVPEPETVDKPLMGRVLASLWTPVAAAILVLAAGYWLLRKTLPPEEKVKEMATAGVLNLSGTHATWTHKSGRRVVLDSLPVGSVVDSSGGRILKKVDSNALAYDQSASLENGSSLYHNCLAIGEKSRPYHLQMADGDGVWLASGSQLQYPDGRRSPYSLTGKALFNVFRDPSRPVEILLPEGKRIKVLGTDFSVNAAKDHGPSRVAVLSGKVRFYNYRDSVPVGAGEEAVAEARGLTTAKIKDPAGEASWVGKAGFFYFVDADLDTVLARVGDWYGLKIVRTTNAKATEVNAELSRSSSPADVLRDIATIENGIIRLSLKNNTIIVSDWSAK